MKPVGIYPPFGRRHLRGGGDGPAFLDGERPLYRPAGPNLLLDLDYRTPTVQAFPTTATGVIPGRTATEIWLVDEASGSHVGEVGGVALVPSGSPLQGQTAAGIYDGTDAYSKGCSGLNNTGQLFSTSAAGSSFMDMDATTSFAMLFVFRRTGPLAAGDLRLFRKYSSGAGYFMYMTGSNGRLSFRLYSGGVMKDNAAGTSNYGDGAWHACLAVVDRNADNVGFYSDLETTPADAIAAGDMSNAGNFQFGPVSSAANATDFAYCAVFTGTDAEGLGQSDFDAFWTHATDPGSPALDTYTRASLACPVVGNESGFGVRVAKYGSGQFAHGYNSAFSHTTQLGALIESASTNLCLYSEDQSNAAWVATTATKTANQGEAPDGTQTADDLTATGAAGYVQQAITTVASTQYTEAVFLARNQASDVGGRLVMYDISNGAELGATAFTATSEWQRVEVTASTIAGGVSTGLRIEITTSGESILVWGADFKAGSLSSYIPTTSASATRAMVDSRLANSGGNTYLKSAAGEIEETWIIPETLGAVEVRFDTTSPDRIQTQINASPTSRLFISDSAGVQKQLFSTASTLDWSTEQVMRARWNSQDDYEGHTENADILYGASRRAGADTTWTTGTGATTIYLGQRNDGATGVGSGLLARLRIWDAPRSDTP